MVSTGSATPKPGVNKALWLLCLTSALPLVTAGLEWELLANHSTASPPSRRDHALGFVVTGNWSYLILFGGRSHSNDPLQDTWVFDVVNGKENSSFVSSKTPLTTGTEKLNVEQGAIVTNLVNGMFQQLLLLNQFS